MRKVAKQSRDRHAPSVEPALGWTYLSREALARAKAQMDEESMGVRDEIGFLTIHQRYADHFFPGTSVLHTRARYALFVPWLFEDLAGKIGPSAQRALRERERQIAGRLKDAGEAQVIGSHVFPKPSSQPPSVVYWKALAVWGIIREDKSKISREKAHRLLKARCSSTDDDGQPLINFDPPFVHLPNRPKNWQSGDISLRLTKKEADFLRQHLGQLRVSGSMELCLLSKLVSLKNTPPAEMWSDEIFAVAGADKALLIRARQAACLGGIGRAIYDALLERSIEFTDKRQISARHRSHLKDIIAEQGEVAAKLDIAALEADIGALPARLHSVVTATKDWIGSGSQDPKPLFEVYAAAEARKGPRARLPSTPNARARRLEWSNDEHVLATPLHYRWKNVRTLLNDLAEAK
nr:DUF6361 family protein [uncultured Cohaesibacter sp.]